jgi:hypothetical protein
MGAFFQVTFTGFQAKVFTCWVERQCLIVEKAEGEDSGHLGLAAITLSVSV